MIKSLSDDVGNNQLKYIRWCGWHETGRRCRSQESSPTTYLRCPYGAQRRFKRRYVLMLKLGWFDNIYETFLRLNICEEREEGIFWDFVTVSHISKESQKFHDIDSEEFQLYKHALEEEYKMQVFSDKMLQSSPFCFCFIIMVMKFRLLPLGRLWASLSSRWVVAPVIFPPRCQIQIQIPYRFQIEIQIPHKIKLQVPPRFQIQISPRFQCTWLWTRPVQCSLDELITPLSGGIEGDGTAWRSRGFARRYPSDSQVSQPGLLLIWNWICSIIFCIT